MLSAILNLSDNKNGIKFYEGLGGVNVETKKAKIGDEYYEEYSQLDNGVGMLRSFECEAQLMLKMLTKEECNIERKISIAKKTELNYIE